MKTLGRMYPAEKIAKYVINFHSVNKMKLTVMRLQPILYYIQGFSIWIRKGTLFSDTFETWELLAAVPGVYYKYGGFGGADISRTFNGLDFLEDEILLMNNVISYLSQFETITLCKNMREEDPYKYVYKVYGVNSMIPNECLEKYFGSLTNGITINI